MRGKKLLRSVRSFVAVTFICSATTTMGQHIKLVPEFGPYLCARNKLRLDKENKNVHIQSVETDNGIVYVDTTYRNNRDIVFEPSKTGRSLVIVTYKREKRICTDSFRYAV